MQTLPPPEPLTDAELDRLGEFLRQCKGGRAMNLEELDGFFAALIAGPDMVSASEYYPHVFGGTLEETTEFDNMEQIKDALGLLSKHWNTIAGTLYRDEVYLPLLLEDDRGVAPANDWARGFMRGVELRKDDWADLINSEEFGASVLPMMILYHEHDTDPETRPPAIGPEQREKIIIQMAAGLLHIYRHYLSQRQSAIPRPASRTARREATKVGRHDPCPCGSGKKYKHCHGGTTLH